MEDTQRLEQDVAEAHQELNHNLEVLETRARELTDWRAQFEKRPLLMLGLAAGGGLIAASLIGGSSSRRGRQRDGNGDAQEPVSYAPRLAPRENRAWHGMREALGAIASATAVELLHEAVPGFKEHFDRIKARVEDSRHTPMSTTHGPA